MSRPECDCFIPVLEGAGQHSLGCAIFKGDRSNCCGAAVRFQIDYAEGTVLDICTRCGYQCRRVEPSERNGGSA